MQNTKHMVLAALFIAAGLILPMFFHMVSMSGAVFLPMHIPVFLGGLFLGWRHGLIIGVVTPLLSSLFTGMPPLLPMAPMMAVELGLYGMTGGYLYRSRRFPLLAALLLAMLIGRLGTAAMLGIFAGSLGIHAAPIVYVGASMLKGMPGILIQLGFIPVFMRYLNRNLAEWSACRQ